MQNQYRQSIRSNH